MYIHIPDELVYYIKYLFLIRDKKTFYDLYICLKIIFV